MTRTCGYVSVDAVPVAGLGLILGIDRFMSEARALTNLVGEGVATLVAARWSGGLDRERLDEQLAAGSLQPSSPFSSNMSSLRELRYTSHNAGMLPIAPTALLIRRSLVRVQVGEPKIRKPAD